MQEDTPPRRDHAPTVPSQSGEAPLEQAYAPMSVAHNANPYLMYARMRREEPVLFSPRVSAWVISCYEEVTTVLRDHRRFAMAIRGAGAHTYTPEVQELMRSGPLAGVPTIVASDPPVHTRLRSYGNRAMSASLGIGTRLADMARNHLTTGKRGFSCRPFSLCSCTE